MIRKSTEEDISDEELEKVINPFYDNYHEFLVTDCYGFSFVHVYRKML